MSCFGLPKIPYYKINIPNVKLERKPIINKAFFGRTHGQSLLFVTQRIQICNAYLSSNMLPWNTFEDLISLHESTQLMELVEKIKHVFQTLHPRDRSISPYDTAWVAMVPSLEGHDRPQFPKTLEWIIAHQLCDGSWGDKDLFVAYDRIVNSLACLIALKTWDMGDYTIAKGVDFICKTIQKIEVDTSTSITTQSGVVFLTLLDDARALGLNLPYDSPMVSKMKMKCERKFKRIPMELVHGHAMFFTLEGLHHIVDWKQLVKLQSKNGFCFQSIASMACALKYTGDQTCLNYLSFVLQIFGNGVPKMYHVDLFEQLCMIDQLDRLGISRYFMEEIRESLDYVYLHWTSKAISWSYNPNVKDGDVAIMAFRLLRLHGYNVSPDVFEHVRSNGEDRWFMGETSQSLTTMFNMYQASQLMFPGEPILQEMNHFTKTFLEDIQKKNAMHNKLVEYALKYPWERNLPRIETRHYIEQFGVEDVWIRKSLMFNANHKIFLNLAKGDFNMCQALHKRELQQVLRWIKESQFERLKFARLRPREAHFSAAATFFEPEYSIARVVWTMTIVLTTLLDDFYDTKGSLEELQMFRDAIKSWDSKRVSYFNDEMKILFFGLYNMVNMVNEKAKALQGHEIISHLRNYWLKWIDSQLIEAEWRCSHYFPSLMKYLENAKISIGLEVAIGSALFFMGEVLTTKDLAHPNLSQIMDLVNTIGRLRNDIQSFKRENAQSKITSVNIILSQNPTMEESHAIEYLKSIIDSTMVSLVEVYFSETKVPNKCKKLHLSAAKIYNFFFEKEDAYSSNHVIANYVDDILFNPIP